MQQVNVDDDILALVWKLANPKPFENLTFNAALRRVFQEQLARHQRQVTLMTWKSCCVNPWLPKRHLHQAQVIG